MENFYQIPRGLCAVILLCAFLADCTARAGDTGLESREHGATRGLRGASEKQEGVTEMSLRDSVLATFVGEIGVQEIGGENRGERIGEYLAVTGLGEGYAWCASFLAWGFTKHGVPNPQSAWTPDWFPEEHTVYVRGAGSMEHGVMPVDVIGIYFRSKGRIAHVGVIERVTDHSVITIEGNTNDGGDREGDRVMRKRRLKRQVYKVSRWISN